jgi:hypothetical protein
LFSEVMMDLTGLKWKRKEAAWREFLFCVLSFVLFFSTLDFIIWTVCRLLFGWIPLMKGFFHESPMEILISVWSGVVWAIVAWFGPNSRMWPSLRPWGLAPRGSSPLSPPFSLKGRRDPWYPYGFDL